MLDMLLEIVGVYKDVVEVDNSELIEVRTEDVIDVGLEGSGGSGKTERHDEVFKVTIAGTKGGFVFVSFGDAKTVVGFDDVQSSEILLATEAIEHLGDKRERISIFDHDPIEGTIVDTET